MMEQRLSTTRLKSQDIATRYFKIMTIIAACLWSINVSEGCTGSSVTLEREPQNKLQRVIFKERNLNNKKSSGTDWSQTWQQYINLDGWKMNSVEAAKNFKKQHFWWRKPQTIREQRNRESCLPEDKWGYNFHLYYTSSKILSTLFNALFI